MGFIFRTVLTYYAFILDINTFSDIILKALSINYNTLYTPDFGDRSLCSLVYLHDMYLTRTMFVIYNTTFSQINT